MTTHTTRRQFSSGLALVAAGLPLSHNANLLAEGSTDREIAPFRTPYKYGKLVLAGIARCLRLRQQIR